MRRRISVEDGRGLRPHDHVVWFGDSEADLYALARTVLDEGIERNEKVMFVAADPRAELLTGARPAGELVGSGQLELHSLENFCGLRPDADGSDAAAGAWDPHEQLATIRSAHERALAQGYSGVRLVADVTALAQGPAESFDRWLIWEQLADRFFADTSATGVCWFDARRVPAERQSLLAALHPMRSPGSPDPPFSAFADQDVLTVVGLVGSAQLPQLQRILAALEPSQERVVDLSAAHLLDDAPLRALAGFGSVERPLRLQGHDRLRRHVAALGLADTLVVEEPASELHRCTGCGDVIGFYERAVIVLEQGARMVSAIAEPAVLAQALARYHSGCYAGELGQVT